MSVNPLVRNTAYLGAIAAHTAGRKIQSINPADYAEQIAACGVFADVLESHVSVNIGDPTAPFELSMLGAMCIQSLGSSFITSLNPDDYQQLAQAIAAYFNEAKTNLLPPP